ncbi:hypothetical protein B9J09_06940 [Xylella fastidiosa subsp. pauca]|uniref:phage tail assembly chaperone n=1 Tax=Xylella fastidiosa TaxID=2371 RepID=UPI0005839B1A|nr:putative phage tail assembly chaperone [Xylella fastidiosa]ARO68694.1 hypothetical protein B9J09_06355 [Xylella fastidiosa subsp. pauca]ARO68795.1 hypothetical protein B9J09_06940 [Xylella fastidiosa subsp. pauca]AVI20783.1 hypothetical protein BCV75_05900 [Xylella fastidiosa]AVI22811.1 hypothetical protein BC375_05965 [Xylella fastidiosa]KIA57912.1 hypothetical protein RA12_07720 [Xylella fastidiosa]
MNNEHRFEIEGLTYLMTPANAMAAWQSLKRAGVLLRGMDADALANTQGTASVALGTLLSHLGDPAVTEIEALVFEQTAIKTPEGTTYRLSPDRLNEHFNTRRTHLLRVLMEGVKYQYSDFFAGGMAAFQELNPMPSAEKQ